MSRYEMCQICGHRLHRYYNEWGYWDGETYYCQYCADEESEDDEQIDVYEAALIWASNGKDEDYTYGYSEDELENAL